MRLLWTEYNIIFQQAMDQQHIVTGPELDGLKRAMIKENFRTETVNMPGTPLLAQKVARPPANPPAATQNVSLWYYQAQKVGKSHAKDQNPWTASALQVAVGFRLRRAIGAAADVGVEIPAADHGCHFCLIYHIRGVCNSHCGGWISHRTL